MNIGGIGGGFDPAAVHQRSQNITENTDPGKSGGVNAEKFTDFRDTASEVTGRTERVANLEDPSTQAEPAPKHEVSGEEPPAPREPKAQESSGGLLKEPLQPEAKAALLQAQEASSDRSDESTSAGKILESYKALKGE